MNMTLEEFRQALIEKIKYAEDNLPNTEQFMWYRTGLCSALTLLDDCIAETLGVKDIYSYNYKEHMNDKNDT